MSTVLVSKKPCEKEIAKVYWILAEIASDATLTQTLCSKALQSDSKEEMILAIEVIVKKMGWSADHGTGIIKGDGKPTHNGGAEEWFMFPSYETVEGLEIFPRLKEKKSPITKQDNEKAECVLDVYYQLPENVQQTIRGVVRELGIAAGAEIPQALESSEVA